METICEIIRKAEQNYLTGNVALGKYVSWSMHDTIERIDAYLNSKHISGDQDALGRDKPFFNIVSAATNIWYRATDIDRKDIKFVPRSAKSIPLAFVANVMLQTWMDQNRFGQFLNSWGRALSAYGSAVVKFVEKDGDLIPTVVPWNRYIADPVQFDALPRIEKLYFTPAQLRRMPQYDQQQVDELIEARVSRRTLDKQKKDIMAEFIEVYEVHGELDERLLDDEPDLNLEDKNIKYRQQMHVVSYVEGKDKDGYEDFTLYKGKEGKDPYMITHLIEQDGRTLAIGAVEYLFEAQWMTNHTVKNMKDNLDLASRLIFQTADTHFVGRNVLAAIETGDILVHDENRPLERIANDKPDVSALQNFGVMWQNLGQELTNTPDVTRGVTQAQPLTYGLGQILNNNSNSLFEIMTESKGLSVEDMTRMRVIPHLKKQLKNKDEVVAILDDAGIQEIDAMYVPREAVRRFNKRTMDTMLNGTIADNMPSPFDPQQEQQNVQQDMGSLGNKRFFKPDELDQTQWDQIFSDFEWDSIRVEVTNESVDKQAVVQTLTTLLATVGAAASQGRQLTPDERMIMGRILTETGSISPMQLSTAKTSLPMTPTVPSGGAPLEPSAAITS